VVVVVVVEDCDDFWMREKAAVRAETVSSQAGRSQSSTLKFGREGGGGGFSFVLFLLLSSMISPVVRKILERREDSPGGVVVSMSLGVLLVNLEVMLYRIFL